MQNRVDATFFFDEKCNSIDIEITTNNRSFLMLGASGLSREKSLIKQYETRNKDDILPVFIGFGVGYAIKEFLDSTKEKNTCIAIVDKEDFLYASELDEIRNEILNNPRVLHIKESNAIEALRQLTHWQAKNNHLAFFPLVNSQYLRIDSDYYKEIQNNLTASLKFDFWAKARKKRFQAKETTFLFIASKYFLMGELVSACDRLGVKSKLLILEDDELGKEEFISILLENIIQIQPDAIFTLNHLGIDSSGILTDLLDRLELPLISWFLDNPHLVLHEHKNLAGDWLTIFTYDADNIPSLKAAGYTHSYYLPLGTDTERFHPRNKEKNYPENWESNVSFVGNSMVKKVASRLEFSNPPKELKEAHNDIAKNFALSPIHSVREFIESEYSHLFQHYLNLDSLEKRLAFEALITWNATRIYRHNCVEKILEFSPTIVGDDNWKNVFATSKFNINYIDALSYYDHLPQFYTHSKINFNSTSKQMKNAINQRVFDVPASNAFVITDWREQMDDLMQSGKDIISYKELDEIPELISYYLKHENERLKIVEQGRKRVLAEHSWEKRIEKIIEIMRKRYA